VKRVTNSEKRSYLQDYKWLAARIEEIEQELDKPINHDDVHYTGEKAEKDAVKHISKEERLQEERESLLAKKRKIEDAVSKLQNNREYILLSRIYLKGMKVADVIEEMDISVRTYYRILKSALVHLEV
jgi:DNA-directed RNA polymerase specialized sigma subunit